MKIFKCVLAAFLAATTLFAMASCSASVPEDLTATNHTMRTTSSSTPAERPAAKPSMTATSVSCTSNYSEGAFSLDIIMQNDTGQTLILVPDRTGRGDGHWAAQPPSSLAPGACAVINAYSDDPLGLLWLTATYQLPDLTYIPFACQAVDADNGPQCNQTALTTMAETAYHGEFQGTVSNAWQIEKVASSGSVHTHWTLAAGPQSTE